MPPVIVLDVEVMVPDAPAPPVEVAPLPESAEDSEPDPEPEPDEPEPEPGPEPEADPPAGQSSATGSTTLRKAAGMHTRALGQGHLQDLRSIVARAGLGGAVTDTVLVVLGVAQTGHVVSFASKLGSLGVHVGDAHLLTDISVSSSAQV